jgi:hypothetical protein
MRKYGSPQGPSPKAGKTLQGRRVQRLAMYRFGQGSTLRLYQIGPSRSNRESGRVCITVNTVPSGFAVAERVRSRESGRRPSGRPSREMPAAETWPFGNGDNDWATGAQDSHRRIGRTEINADEGQSGCSPIFRGRQRCRSKSPCFRTIMSVHSIS